MGENLSTDNTVTVGAQVGGADIATANVNGSGQSDNNTQTQTGKTYTEDEFKAELDRRTQQAILTAKEKWNEGLNERLKSERDEGVRLAKLSADERAKEEQKKAQEAFEEERSQYRRERLEFETTKQLAELKLPVSFASMLAGKDAESTKANIDTFSKVWSEAIQAAVEEKLKGRTPPAASSGQSESDPFLAGFAK